MCVVFWIVKNEKQDQNDDAIQFMRKIPYVIHNTITKFKKTISVRYL